MYKKVVGLDSVAFGHSLRSNLSLAFSAPVKDKLWSLINNIKSIDDLRKLLVVFSTKTDHELMNISSDEISSMLGLADYSEFIQEWAMTDSEAPEIKEMWHIIKGDSPFTLQIKKFLGEKNLKLESFELQGFHYLVLSPKYFSECQRQYCLDFKGSQTKKLEAFQHFEHIDRKFSKAIDIQFGCDYKQDNTIFRLWAPKQTSVSLRLYDSPGVLSKEEVMNYDPNTGLWSYDLTGDQKGKFYRFLITNAEGESYEVRDPEAKACSINGEYSAIINVKETDPNGWEGISYIQEVAPTQAVIYETHIRDFTALERQQPGKYLGVITPERIKSLKKIGLTHIAFQPLYQFWIQNEADSSIYNWGYNPMNWNSVSGAYSSNPHDPRVAIQELKTMIKVLKENGIGITFDAVYNHVYQETDVFSKIFPGYYLMTDHEGEFLNGSYCGNQVAPDRAFMRKYIVESATYWVKEFKADKLRFDLMGLLDIDTMNLILEKAREINPNIYIYGEPWHMGYLPPEKKASVVNIRKMSEIGMFNGDFRDLMVGNIHYLETKGLLSGTFDRDWASKLKHHISGFSSDKHTMRGPLENAGQNILYVDCHDNYTFFDKLRATYPEGVTPEEEAKIIEEIKKKYMLAVAVMATSQGVPLLYGGSELLRSKSWVRDSYKSNDQINGINWEKESQFSDVQDFIGEIVFLRKTHPAFQMMNPKMIAKHLQFIDSADKTIAYKLIDHANGDIWREIMIVHNFSGEERLVPESGSGWKVAFRRETDASPTTIKGFESMVLFRE